MDKTLCNFLKRQVLTLCGTRVHGHWRLHSQSPDLVWLTCYYRHQYNKEGRRVSYSSIVRGTAVVTVQTRSMIYTACGVSQFTLRAHAQHVQHVHSHSLVLYIGGAVVELSILYTHSKPSFVTAHKQETRMNGEVRCYSRVAKGIFHQATDTDIMRDQARKPDRVWSMVKASK